MIAVSIIIPIYNAHNFILGCLNSVANQTMKNGIECILVDDCGTDDSAELVRQYISNYKGGIRITLLHQSHNQGPSAARNAGIREATGEYVFFLDSDDKITPDCIKLLYGLAQDNNADYVQGTYESNEAYHMPVYGQDMPEFTDDRRYIKRTLLNYNIIPFTPHNRLARRQIILEHNLFFNEKIKVREDFYWMFFMAKHVTRMAICKQPTYYRGYNAESLTHHINREREIQAYRTLIQDFANNIDPFLSGAQKGLLLDTLIMALRSKYYTSEEDKDQLIQTVASSNSFCERLFLRLYLFTSNSKVLHTLIRIYR